MQKTTAAILIDIGKPLVVTEIGVPDLMPGQVLVDVRYSGVCHTQVLEVRGHRGEDKYLPHLLGHEGSGVVRDVGAGVTRVQKGDHVILSWIRGPGATVGGTQYDWDGRAVNAGPITTFSRKTVVSESCVTKVSADFSADLAALVGCAVPTGVGVVLNTLKVQPGESLAVFGVGGVGLCAIGAAAVAGCNPIIAIDLVPEKLALARSLGATHTIDAGAGDVIEGVKATCPVGLDHAVEASGVPAVMRQALLALRPRGGKAAIIGNAPHGETIEIDPSQLNLGKQILGTWGGDSEPARDYPRYCGMMDSGQLDLRPLLSRVYALEDINDALDDLEAGRVARPMIDMGL